MIDVLVAGIGNIFLGDDGFGSEVAGGSRSGAGVAIARGIPYDRVALDRFIEHVRQSVRSSPMRYADQSALRSSSRSMSESEWLK
jgi:hypothetical protein